MKFNLCCLLIILLYASPGQGVGQNSKVNLYVLKVHVKGMKSDDANRYERDFRQLLAQKIEVYDECLRLMGDEDEMTTAGNFFKGDDFEFYQKYGIERTVTIPIRANAIILVTFEHNGEDLYGAIKIYDRERELLISSFNTKPLPSSIGREQRKEFIRTLIHQAFTDYKIIKLVAGILNIDKSVVKCLGPAPEANFSYNLFLSKPRIQEFKFIDESKNTITLHWNIKRKRLFSKKQPIPGSHDNLDVVFFRGGTYNISLTATGLDGSQNIVTKKVKVKWRKPKRGQYLLATAGGVALAYSGVTKWKSNQFYEEHKRGSNPDRDIDYEKANSLHHVSVTSLYAGSLLIGSSILWYLMDSDKSLFKNDKGIKTYPTFGVRSDGGMQFGLQRQF